MTKLYLLPNVFSEDQAIEPFVPLSVKETVQSMDGLIAESEKGGRRYLRRFLSHDQMASMPIKVLSEHTTALELTELLDFILAGQKRGLVTDAGLPCIADPGAPLVRLCHEKGIEVVALVGPSAIILALQLSGFNGQRFTFHGYLPREMAELQRKLSQIEKMSRQDGSTQIWIEAPYRSAKMHEIALETLLPDTRLCIALSVTLPNQRIYVKKITEWRRQSVHIEKEPAVFLLST